MSFFRSNFGKSCTETRPEPPFQTPSPRYTAPPPPFSFSEMGQSTGKSFWSIFEPRQRSLKPSETAVDNVTGFFSFSLSLFSPERRYQFAQLTTASAMGSGASIFVRVISTHFRRRVFCRIERRRILQKRGKKTKKSRRSRSAPTSLRESLASVACPAWLERFPGHAAQVPAFISGVPGFLSRFMAAHLFGLDFYSVWPTRCSFFVCAQRLLGFKPIRRHVNNLF